MEKDEASLTTPMLNVLDWIKSMYIQGFVPINENTSVSV